MASDLPAPITVFWRPLSHSPRAFVWRGRRRRVERVLQRWAVDTGWWNDDVRVDRRYFRVMADGRLFDIYLDRIDKRWFLERLP